MASPNKLKSEQNKSRPKITAENIGIATVGLVALTTLSAGMALGAATAGGAVLYSKKRKRDKEKKKQASCGALKLNFPTPK